jgi:hypothetical protein
MNGANAAAWRVLSCRIRLAFSVFAAFFLFIQIHTMWKYKPGSPVVSLRVTDSRRILLFESAQANDVKVLVDAFTAIMFKLTTTPQPNADAILAELGAWMRGAVAPCAHCTGRPTSESAHGAACA